VSTRVPERRLLGPPKPRRLDQPITVSLEALVPARNVSRHLAATLDLNFVHGWVEDRAAERGRPAIDPVVFFKLPLVMFFEGIRSDRQLIATARRNLAHRWQLGYALDAALPDHASLTRIRQRSGLAVFRRFFEAIVEPCIAAGLVWGQAFSIDATKVAANAALDSLQPRFAVEAHLTRLFAADGDVAADGDADGGDPSGAPAGGDADNTPAQLPAWR
jgi:transposase